MSISINRIRLEFKATGVGLQATLAQTVLIESDWNLKKEEDTRSGDEIVGINRIRLEFKELESELNSAIADGINRIRLEFKEYYLLIMENDLEVLIESDWNLKDSYRYQQSDTQFFVLIESDWNLKYDYAGDLPGLFTVLIESDWNLKITE